MGGHIILIFDSECPCVGVEAWPFCFFCLFSVGTEPRTFHMLGKGSATNLNSQPSMSFWPLVPPPHFFICFEPVEGHLSVRSKWRQCWKGCLKPSQWRPSNAREGISIFLHMMANQGSIVGAWWSVLLRRSLEPHQLQLCLKRLLGKMRTVHVFLGVWPRELRRCVQAWGIRPKMKP